MPSLEGEDPHVLITDSTHRVWGTSEYLVDTCSIISERISEATTILHSFQTFHLIFLWMCCRHRKRGNPDPNTVSPDLHTYVHTQGEALSHSAALAVPFLASSHLPLDISSLLSIFKSVSTFFSLVGGSSQRWKTKGKSASKTIPVTPIVSSSALVLTQISTAMHILYFPRKCKLLKEADSPSPVLGTQLISVKQPAR